MATIKRIQQHRHAHDGVTLFLLVGRMNNFQKNVEQILDCLKNQNQAECNISKNIYHWLTSLNNCFASWSEQDKKSFHHFGR